MDERFYFEPGFSLHKATAADEVRLLRRISGFFNVEIHNGDCRVDISGDEAEVKRACSFFSELNKLFILRKKELERSDIELLFRNFSSSGSDPANMESLWKGRISPGSGRRDIMPRSRRQLDYLNAMRKYDVVFGIGPAGTGKTYLAMAMAVEMFLKGEISRIVLTRPARESGERLGFLPGSLEEKVSPYLRPLYDALYEMMKFEEAQDLIARNIIEVAPLAFMRGRTLNNSFIILDEAQNTTAEQMLMFLTRMGFGSKCVITGDPTQSDLPRNEESGLKRAINTLQSLNEIGFVFFGTGDVVRHALLEKIINSYRYDQPEKGE